MLLTHLALGIALSQTPVLDHAASRDQVAPPQEVAASAGMQPQLVKNAADDASDTSGAREEAREESPVPADETIKSAAASVASAETATGGMVDAPDEASTPEAITPEVSAPASPRPLSYRDVPLYPLYPASPVPPDPYPAERWGHPGLQEERYWEPPRRMRRLARHPLTTVHFAEAEDKTPYSVQSRRTHESCLAPCALSVPATRNSFIFRTSEQTFAHKFNLAGPERTLRMESAGNRGMVAGGAILLSAAIAVDLGFLLGSPIVFSDFEGTKREKYGRWALAAGVSSVITGALLTSGIILIAKGKPRVSQRITPHQASTEDAAALDSLQFSVAPTRDGLSASAGFRF